MVEKMKKNSGFTLVELIVAVALFAIVIGPLFQAFSSSIKANSRARSVLKATQLGTSVMDNVERFSAKGLYDVPLDDVDEALLPRGTTHGQQVRTRTPGSDDYEIAIPGVKYQDMDLNVRVRVTKRATDNPNTSNKYFMFTVDVYVHMNKGVSSPNWFTNEPLVHLRGSVQNID